MNQELIQELTLEEVNVAIPLLVKMQSNTHTQAWMGLPQIPFRTTLTKSVAHTHTP
jgi:hypothetical protein